MSALCSTCGRTPNPATVIVYRKPGAADITRCHNCARILKAPVDFRAEAGG